MRSKLFKWYLTLSFNRSGEVACNLHKIAKALRGTFLDIHNSNGATVHPENGLLIQSLQDLVQSAGNTNEHFSHMLDCWASELEKYAETVCQGEKGKKFLFLLNNTISVLQIMRRQGASFASLDMGSTLNSMIQRYKKSYFDECWVPLKNTLHLNLDEFTTEFFDTCGNQRAWKVTAALRYDLREDIVDLIVPSYEISLSALEANHSRLSGLLCSFERVIAGKKKQKRYTGEELAQEIRELFEG
jgi:hypothetical protein